MNSGSKALIPFVVIVAVVCVFAGALVVINSGSGNNNPTIDDPVEFNVVLDGNTGATLTGDGTYELGSKVTVEASCDDGTTFMAWLNADGEIVSENARYTFTPTSTKTVNLFASCITEVAFNNGDTQLYSEEDWNSAVWKIYKHDGNTLKKIGTTTNGTYHFSDEGLYRVVIDAVDGSGYTVEMTSELKVGKMTFQYQWRYGGDTYGVYVEIQYSDYYHATHNSVSRSFDDVHYTNAISFVTPEEQCIASIAEQIKAQLQTYGVEDEEDIANIVLDLVQMSITYTEDSVMYESDEYWAYPIETLYYLKGDCEDTTFLYSSIMKAMGYDTVVCYVQYWAKGGHAFAMIGLDSCHGTKYSLSGDDGKYYCCETTPDKDYNLSNVGSDIIYYNLLRTSYCFLTDDTGHTPHRIL